MYLGLDIETIPRLSNEMIKQYEDKKIQAINNHKSYKQDTKNKKIEEIKTSIIEFRSGIINSISKDIIKEFSVNPLYNKTCAIGLTYEHNGEEFNVGMAGEDEKALLEFFLKYLHKLSEFGDTEFIGHYLRSFDIPSIRVAIIRNEMDDKFREVFTKRETLFPTKKYDYFIKDLSDLYEGKLDEIANVVLGESKVADGSQVYEMYQNKEFNRMEEYVIDDAKKAYHIFKKSII